MRQPHTLLLVGMQQCGACLTRCTAGLSTLFACRPFPGVFVFTLPSPTPPSPQPTAQDGPWADDERDVRATWRSDRERDDWCVTAPAS
jgi:hypothetical protein